MIVDYIQHKCLLNMGTADLYGSNDPFQRMPRSPKVLASDPNVDDLIVKVDLGNYSQLTPGGEEGAAAAAGEDTAASAATPAAVSRVKSPAAKSLSNKAGTGKCPKYFVMYTVGNGKFDQSFFCLQVVQQRRVLCLNHGAHLLTLWTRWWRVRE